MFRMPPAIMTTGLPACGACSSASIAATLSSPAPMIRIQRLSPNMEKGGGFIRQPCRVGLEHCRFEVDALGSLAHRPFHPPGERGAARFVRPVKQKKPDIEGRCVEPFFDLRAVRLHGAALAPGAWSVASFCAIRVTI